MQRHYRIRYIFVRIFGFLASFTSGFPALCRVEKKGHPCQARKNSHEKMPTPEQLARLNIDKILTAAGWVVQDRRRINLHTASAIALCETDVERGFADYMLFVEGKAIGVVEAKAEGTPLVGVADQSEIYARSKLKDFQRWANPLPLPHESNGEEIRFRDLRDPRSRSRFTFGIHRPETLRVSIEQSNTLRTRLQKLPPLVTIGLRDCQVEAVKGLEKSLSRQHPRALVQMATGAGKTGWPSPNVTGSSSLVVLNEFYFLSIVPISANRQRTNLISGTARTLSAALQTNTSFNASTESLLSRVPRL